MKKLMKSMVIVIALTACTHKKENNTNSLLTTVDNIENQKSENMKNLISIVEIPTTDFSRAVAFYQAILDVRIEEVDMAGTKMGILPSGGETVNVVLVKGNDYRPTTDGAVLYLNAGNNLQPTLVKVEQHGGQVIVPKTEISPEIGYFALFIDTEGNKLGLHSSN